jgi:hypothetical protein
MDLWQLEESYWDTLKANKMHMKSEAITHHMPRFNIHEYEVHRTAHRIPQKVCSKFLTSQKNMVSSTL